MIPVLADLGVIKIFTFGVFLVLALFWGSFLMWRNFLLTSFKEEDMFDGLFLSILGGLFVSRLFYVASHFSDFGFDLSKFILINGYPGLMLYGFVFGATASMWLFLRSRKIRFLEVMDYIVPSALLAAGFGKLGAFFSGDEMGAVTTFPIALRVVGAVGLRHLTPLYESLLFFAGAFIAYRILFSVRRESLMRGTNYVFFWWYFALINTVFDYMKANRTIVAANLSVNGIISLLLLLTFSLYFIYYFRSFIGHWISSYGKRINKAVSQKTKRNT